MIAELAECTASVMENAATVEDIPDGDVKDSIKAKLLEVAMMVTSNNPDMAQIIAELLVTLPIVDVQDIILYFNTQEYRDKYLTKLLMGEDVSSLDAHLVGVGRPADGLE